MSFYAFALFTDRMHVWNMHVCGTACMRILMFRFWYIIIEHTKKKYGKKQNTKVKFEAHHRRYVLLVPPFQR